jgi:hemerythrin-like domain-containing protein
MQMYLYVHDAILRDAAHDEARAKHLDRDNVQEISAFAEHMHWFRSIVKVHEKTEEEVLFPALNARFSFVAESYAFDHDDFEPNVFVGLAEAMHGLQHAAATSDRRDLANLLYRQSVALHEHMRLHISKENELLLPKVESEFDVDEQVRLAGAMAGLIQPAMMGDIVAWVYRGQTAEDREGMLRFLIQVLPPEALAGICQMLAAKDDIAWAETLGRVPELATSPARPVSRP